MKPGAAPSLTDSSQPQSLIRDRPNMDSKELVAAAATLDIELITGRILDRDDLDSYPTDQVPLIVDCLRRRCAQFIEAKDYVSAARSDQFSRILMSHEQLDIVGDMQETRATKLHEKLDEAQVNVDASKKKWEQLHGRMKLTRDTEFSQMSAEKHATQSNGTAER
jgi:hypothetical protein